MALSIASIVFVVGSVAAFVFNFSKVLRIFRAGTARKIPEDWQKRLVMVIQEVFLHRKLLRQKAPGLLHVVIFWGFVILSLGTLEWIYHGFTGGMKFDFLGASLYRLFLFSQDLMNTLVLLAVIYAFYRRIFVKPKRMADNSWKSKADAYFILFMIGALVVSNLLAHSVQIHGYDGGNERIQALTASAQPVAAWMAGFYGEGEFSSAVYYFWWWLHLVVIFGFLNFLPFSKHLHVILALPNVFLAKTEPRGQLSTPNLEDDTVESFGAEKVEDLSWKNLMDAYTCTECGRCNEFCPTATTGKALKPKTLMIDLRAAATGRASLYAQMSGGNLAVDQLSQEQQALYEQRLVPDIFSADFVWDCTSCGACVEACPVMIDHVESLVEMRRALVLNRGEAPDEATVAFNNWETTSNPWGIPEEQRQDWLVQRGVPLFESDKDFDYLYYIGCAGSFDDRNKKVVDSVVKVLETAGVKFGILGKEERCNGETARRLGNEWLAQQMMQTNIELLQGKGAKKIITSCPHCFNTLANEYPSLGGKFEVLHHTEVINDLVKAGRLKLQKGKIESVTYHDSCYIGRYNDIYNEPRNVLAAVSQEKPVEMKRSRDKGFCCGAGGGRMWLEETTGTRINENRAKEIIETGAKTVSVACPFCMTMISDGLRSQNREDIAVRDLAEIVAESLYESGQSQISGKESTGSLLQ